MARTARQLAASRRNIAAAQRASAASRRGKKRSAKTGHHYGSGRTGRKTARRAKYGSKKHGISIAQQQRRDKRSRKWKNRASVGLAVAGTGAAIYSNYHQGTTKAQRAAHKRKIKAAPKDFAHASKAGRMNYKLNRQMGHKRTKSAKAGARTASMNYRYRGTR